MIWIAITSILIHLRQKAKKAEKRELAESLEDARIFASSRHIMDGGFPHPSYSQQTMPLNSMKNGKIPNDQVSKSSTGYNHTNIYYLILALYTKIYIFIFFSFSGQYDLK